MSEIAGSVTALKSSNVIDAQEIRDRLRNHLGEKKYQKLVMRVKPEAGRWPFWADKMWPQFVAANPDCDLELDQLLSVLSECPLFGAKVLQARYLTAVKSWLHGPCLDFREVEAKHSWVWSELKPQLREGDVLREFCSPPESWDNLCGCAGIAIVREGEVVEAYANVIN